MAEALYRKYRPNTFAQVAEQGHVVRTIQNQLAQGKVAHAYLFAGPRGVGKTTIARLLAKALNCETRKAGESEPCNTCQSCLEMKEGRMLDVVEIDAASQTKVEETRENIIENVRFAPTRGKFKVFIIDEVHMLSTASFNAILKTLEEPPSHAIFVLATTELHKIPATIISRCQRFDFHRIPVPDMMERLRKIAADEGKSVEENVLATVARLSEGCLRDAESLLGQLFALGETSISMKEASLILPATHLDVVGHIARAVGKKDVREALMLLNDLVEHGGSVKHALDEMIEYARSMMFASLGHVHAGTYDPETLKMLQETAALRPAKDYQHFLDLLLQARSRQSLGAYPQIPFEIAIVEACADGALVPVAEPAPKKAPVAPEQKPQFTPAKNELPPSALSTFADRQAPPAANTTVAVTDELVVMNLLELQEKWGRCCSYVAEKNVALPLILKTAKPVAVDGGKVTISFAYEFHTKAMKEAKNLRLLSEAMTSVLMATPTEIECITEKSSQGPEGDPVDALVEAFGGEVL